MRQFFELRVGALSWGAELGVGAVGGLLRVGFALAFVWGDHVVSGFVEALVALICQGDQTGAGQSGKDLPDPGRGGVGSRAR